MALKIAIIGGSGFYELPGLSKVSQVYPKTKYGYPSDCITIGTYQGQQVAFLPRHGRKHLLPPHRVPYKANITALKKLGVESIVATCIAGSLKKEIKPGDFVVPNQFVNLTWGRDDYFDFDQSFIHLPMARPYCPCLSRRVLEICNRLRMRVHFGGVVVVTQGPRFATLAESSFFIAHNWDLVNMTQYPECYFARELGLCYAACAAITDYDPGVGKDLQLNSRKMGKILEIFEKNITKLKKLSLEIVKIGEEERDCECSFPQLKEYYRQVKEKPSHLV